MDEVDAITPKRETSSRGMEKRIVAQVRVLSAVLVFFLVCSRYCLCIWVARTLIFADFARQCLGPLIELLSAATNPMRRQRVRVHFSPNDHSAAECRCLAYSRFHARRTPGPFE